MKREEKSLSEKHFLYKRLYGKDSAAFGRSVGFVVQLLCMIHGYDFLRIYDIGIHCETRREV